MAVNGDPKEVGEVMETPPGMSLPPENGYTPFWEKVRGPLYVPNNEVLSVNLSIGRYVEFYLMVEVGSSGANINIAYDISNI